jgi:hypothetical protein
MYSSDQFYHLSVSCSESWKANFKVWDTQHVEWKSINIHQMLQATHETFCQYTEFKFLKKYIYSVCHLLFGLNQELVETKHTS